MDKEMASEDLDDKLTETAEDKPDTICGALEISPCFRPLNKTQYCVLIVIAMVMFAVALLILIVLIGIVASHDQRIKNLEGRVGIMVAENAQLLYNAEQDRLRFDMKLEQKIVEASNQFSLIYIQTLSLFSQNQELINKVELLSNKTDTLDAGLQELEEEVTLLMSQNTSLNNNNTLESLLRAMQQSQADSLTSQLTARLTNLQSLLEAKKQNALPLTLSECERVRMCLELVDDGDQETRTCSKLVITTEEYRKLKQEELLNGVPVVKLYYECV